MSIARWLRQARAVAIAEIQRLLTTPVWAALLALWTLVCGLFVQVVAARAVEQPLPAGETPMSAFFRFFPGLLPLLLIVFVPQLTMDALAGRRERGRLQHLQLSGLAPGALVLGSFVAIAGMLLLLVLPIALFHFILGDSDAGATAAAIVTLIAQATLIAAIGLVASAWSPSRLAAALIASAIGLAWWIADVFAPAVRGLEAGDDLWQRLFGLAQPIHDAAVGSLDLVNLMAAAVVTVALVFLARCALRWRGWRERGGIVAATLACTVAVLANLAGTRASVDLAAAPALAPATVVGIAELAERGPVRVTLIATTAMSNDPIDGPLIGHLRRVLRAADDHGLHWRTLDPERSPRAVLAYRDRFAIADRELTRPLMIVEHLDRGRVVDAEDLAAVVEESGRRRLAALDVERALARSLARLGGRLPQVAWLTTPEVRPAVALAPTQRLQAVGAWQHHLADAGFAIRELERWPLLADGDFDLVVVPGLQRHVASPAVAALAAHLEGGGHLLLALDPCSPADQPELAELLRDYGIAWTGSHLRAPGGGAVATRPSTASAGPTVALAQHGLGAHLPAALALTADQSRRGVGSLGTWLAAPAGTEVVAPQGVGRLEHEHPCLLTSAPVSADDHRGRLAVLASAQALADEHIDRAGNRLLPAGLAHWLVADDDGDESGAAATAGTLGATRIASGRLTVARWTSGLLIPLLAAAVGFGTWWWRRRR